MNGEGQVNYDGRYDKNVKRKRIDERMMVRDVK